MSSKFYWGLAVSIVIVLVASYFYYSTLEPKAYNLAGDMARFRTEGVPDFDLPIIHLTPDATKAGPQSLRLKSVKSNLIFVNYWASWCAPCIHEIPSLLKLAKMYQKGDQLTVLAVSIEDSERT